MTPAEAMLSVQEKHHAALCDALQIDGEMLHEVTWPQLLEIVARQTKQLCQIKTVLESL